VRSRDGAVLSCDSRYFTTSLDPSSVTASGLQSFVREHWQVENCLHFVKDRHHTKRLGLAECFAALTNATPGILRLIHPPGQPLRATAESIQWFPRSSINRLGFAMKK
jgi:hypothetical protein